MSKYSVESAICEIDNTETIILQKVEQYLKNGNALEVAKILTLVIKESHKLDEEARRLKLVGELNLDI